MNIENNPGLVKIHRALISVSDKTGIVEFARELKRFDVEIISTGGTARALRKAGIEVRDVSDITGFPEMMDGRIKTLHPRLHGGLLALRDNPQHVKAMSEHGIEPIDMVIINLYPFEETIAREGATLEESIEQIDIGGPALMRSAAKNFDYVAVVSTPEHYSDIIDEMNEQGGSLSLATRGGLAAAAYGLTAAYDFAIGTHLMEHLAPEAFEGLRQQLSELELEDFADEDEDDEVDEDWQEEAGEESDYYILHCDKIEDLRYGENPHQSAALYDLTYENAHEMYDPELPAGIAQANLLSGKEMSFNNYVDADAAWQLVSDFYGPACAIIKHTNPAGVGLGESGEAAYRKALATDPVSAFGGIVAFNRPVDEGVARAVVEIFTEVIIAPAYEERALEILRSKKNLRVLLTSESEELEKLEFKQISGGMLVQTKDARKLNRDDLAVVSKRAPSEEEIRALLFAWTVCKHTKSNAIVYAREGQTVGIGAGQMSRVDSVKLGAMRAQLPIENSVLASDAFFPFRDGIDEAAKHGIIAVVQPGGSVRDAEVIAAADEHNLAMVFTGVRHFKH
jgi:phosphoribosylaminoimidazolecarboxamide formyltransferase/IMP cyclohydrolase